MMRSTIRYEPGEVVVVEQDPLSVFKSMLDAINDHDVDAQAAHFHPDYERFVPCHPHEYFKGRDVLHRNWTGLMEAVPDLRVEVERSVVSGSDVWLETHFQGGELDGSAYDVRGVIIATVQDGLITAARVFLEDVEYEDPTPAVDALADSTSGS